MKTVFKAATIAVAMAAAQGAMAWEAGDFVFRSGAVTVAPDDDSDQLNLDGAGKLPGTGVTVDDDTQLMLNIMYMATDHIGVEVLGATPFKHTIDTKGLADLGLADVKLATTRHLPPTVTAVWYPMESSSSFQPFIGLGVNYTYFFDEDVSGAAKDALGAGGLDLDDSWGLVGRAGADFIIDDCWSVHAGVYYMNIETDASVNTALGKVTTSVDINPWVYTIGLGYTF